MEVIFYNKYKFLIHNTKLFFQKLNFFNKAVQDISSILIKLYSNTHE